MISGRAGCLRLVVKDVTSSFASGDFGLFAALDPRDVQTVLIHNQDGEDSRHDTGRGGMQENPDNIPAVIGD